MPVIARLLADGRMVASRKRDGTETEVTAEALHSYTQDLFEVVTITQAEYQAILQAPRAVREARNIAYLAETDRQAFVAQLKTATPAQIEAWIRNQLNADAVVDLATAKTYCKRVETAFVAIVKCLTTVVVN